MTRVESILSNKKIGFNIKTQDLLIIFTGFFISRVSMMGELTPFGVAFLASYILMKGSNIYLLVSIILGTSTLYGVGGIEYYIVSILIYWIFTRTREGERYTLIKASSISALIFLIFRLLTMIVVRSHSPYGVFIAMFEGLLVFTMTYIFSFSMPIADIHYKNMSGERIICSFITVALILSGLNNLLFFGISLKNIIITVLIIHLSYTHGVLLGTSASIVLGLISYISHTEMPFIISILAVGGLLSGIFRDLGKAGSILGFILGNSIISFYINKLGTSFLDYRELFFAAIVFLVESKYIKIDLKSIVGKELFIEERYTKKKEKYISNRLENIGELFQELAYIFERSIEEGKLYSSAEGYGLIDDICNKTCKGCTNFKGCWEEDYYSTYLNMFNLVGIIENKGLKREDIGNSIGDFCQYSERLEDNIWQYYKNLEREYNWNKRLMEQRGLLVEQLQGVGHILENMGQDVYSNPMFNEELEELLVKELKNNRINIQDITVAEIEKGEIEVLVELDEAIEEYKVIERIKTIISDSLGFPMWSDYSFSNTGSKRKYLRLYRANRFSTMTKVSMVDNSDNRMSGDSYTFGETSKNTFMAISDGMGVGKKASRESSIAMELLEKMMDTNMSKNMAIRTINSVLRIKSNDEIFTTLDLGFIDLYTGKLQILKNGAPATFIKKKDKVEIINSRSLPIGILENVDFNIYEDDLEDGDMVIMMSDGVLDSNRNVDDGERWMQDIIMNMDSQNPEIVSKRILEIANFVGENHPRDDMTVMVTKIWKNI